MKRDETNEQQGIFGSKENLIVMMIMVLGVFVAILNETLLNVALPKIMDEFGVIPSTVQWLSTGYLLVVGVLIPVTAYLIQRFTTRMLFLSAMVLFTLGTLVAAVSPLFSILLLGRMLQACGTGLLFPLLTNVVFSLVPLERRGAAMGMIGIVITFAPAIGPTLSGIVVEYVSWRVLFYGVLPIALMVILLASLKLKNVTEVTKPSIDLLSLLLSTIGFGGIVYGFSSAGGENVAWTDIGVMGPILLGVLSIALFSWRQLKLTDPLLDMGTFQFPIFRLSVVIMIIIMMAMFSTMILLPMFLQQGLGYNPMRAGLIMLPGGIIMGIMSPITGRLFDRYGAKWLAVTGLVLVGSMLLNFSFITAATPYLLIMFFNTVLMLGISMLMMPVMTNALNHLPSRLYPHGTAIISTLQQVGGAVGTALFIAVMSSTSERFISNASEALKAEPKLPLLAMTAGMNMAFLISFCFVLIGLIFSFYIKGPNLPEVKKKPSVNEM